MYSNFLHYLYNIDICQIRSKCMNVNSRAFFQDGCVGAKFTSMLRSEISAPTDLIQP